MRPAAAPAAPTCLAVIRWCMRRFLSSPSWIGCAPRSTCRGKMRCAAKPAPRARQASTPRSWIGCAPRQTAASIASSVRRRRRRPSGLTAALVAIASANVTLIERDFHYSRPVWFDLATTASRRRAQLRAWGFFELRPPVVPDDAGSPSSPCRLRARALLALAAALAGVDARRRRVLRRVCRATASSPSPRTAAAPTAVKPEAPAARRAGEPLLARNYQTPTATA